LGSYHVKKFLLCTSWPLNIRFHFRLPFVGCKYHFILWNKNRGFLLTWRAIKRSFDHECTFKRMSLVLFHTILLFLSSTGKTIWNICSSCVRSVNSGSSGHYPQEFSEDFYGSVLYCHCYSLHKWLLPSCFPSTPIQCSSLWYWLGPELIISFISQQLFEERV